MYWQEGKAMANLNYKHLRYFWTVAKLGSIARASEQLHLTPQSISGQLGQLEVQTAACLLHVWPAKAFGDKIRLPCSQFFNQMSRMLITAGFTGGKEDLHQWNPFAAEHHVAGDCSAPC